MKQLNKKELKKFRKSILKRKKSIVLVLENIQYARNVAGLFRTADAAGVEKLYLTGISHHPPFGKELRKVSRSKEKNVNWEHTKETGKVLNTLKNQGFYIVAIELTDRSFPLNQINMELKDKKKVAFIAGSEVYGVTKKTLTKCHSAVYIPMYGKGASLNVSASVGIILFNF